MDRAPPAARRRTVVSRPRLSTHPPRRVPLLCRLGADRRHRFRLLRQAAAFHPPALYAVAQVERVAAAGGGRLAGGRDGMVCAAGPGGRLWQCQPGIEWPDGAWAHAPAGAAQAHRHRILLRHGQCGRHLRPQPFHWSHDGRRGGQRGSPPAAGLYRQRRRLRAGGNGSGVRGHRPRPAHFRDHDLRDDARLLHHRAAHDFQPHQLLHLKPLAA